MYDANAFELIRQLKFSERGELEISALNGEYVKRSEMEYDILEGDWTDAGTLESLQLANQLLMKCNNEIQE